jgi:hypothetical protein
MKRSIQQRRDVPNPRLTFSARPAESHDRKLRMKNDSRCSRRQTAENGPISHSFLHVRLTVSNDEDCYTFEHFASHRDEIRTAYYYYY